jgi:hypothetical protein
VIGLLFAWPMPVAAHAELVSSSPADGATLTSTPGEIVLTYSEALDPSKSSIALHGADGAEIARGGVDPDNDTVMRMTPPELNESAYEIRSTAAALDGHIEHEIVRFGVALPPSIPPTETPTSAPPSIAETAASPSPSPAASPSPSAAGDQTTSTGADLVIPIVVVLALVVVLGAMLMRGRLQGGGQA